MKQPKSSQVIKCEEIEFFSSLLKKVLLQVLFK
jgi:hypothetical protein